MRIAQAVFTGLLALAGLAGAQRKEIPLSLDDCIRQAVKNNLNLAAEGLTPEMGAEAVGLAREIFIPGISFALGQSSNNSASFSWISAADQISTRSGEYQVSLSQLIPTGGRLQATLYSYKTTTTESFMTINPRYGSTLAFEFSQPLLRNFGPVATRRAIIVAKNDWGVSKSEFRRILMDTVTEVEEAYWNLVYSIQNLEARRDSLKYAQDLFYRNQKELEAGLISPVEIFNARAEVAGREADIIQAEAEVRDRGRGLASLINLAPAEGGGDVAVVPTDSPDLDESPLAEVEAVGLALANRPELEAGRMRSRTTEVNLSVARNGLLPNLSFNVSYWSPGVSGTRILYQDDNPLTGVIVGKVPGGAADALKDAMRLRYRNWSVNVTLDIPVNSVVSRAEYARARLASDQSALRLKYEERRIVLEVQTALNAVETNFKRALAYRASRELEEEKLRAEEKKLAAGLSTSYLVLQHQRDLAAARSNELRATVDYNLSLARRDRALGRTLETKHIQVSD
ncbi:MAG TPA: TolC family protein [Candidatus Aminicenantes bacterium]|nr:TolC family protein [Candidatus Aminicenantes bacterium]HRY65169.1 TolC family protein [Candidatus Aminicenantes bacterium]HRZ72363.1 TolC family protein [Candidatus Aminicenantes bacterium]